MFDRLKKKWKVKGWQLGLIILTFALGGSMTGFVAKKVMNILPISIDWLWAIIYILLVTIIWPVAVVIVSIPFGQFNFFWRYIRKIGEKMGIGHVSNGEKSFPGRLNIAIFASGAGSNARKIIEYFNSSEKKKPEAHIALIVSNNPVAGVLDIAREFGIPVLLIEKEKFFRGDGYTEQLASENIKWIILAGFLWKLPSTLLDEYKNRIINIHPALLPAYGGKGMYGMKVHEAVIANNEKESGISIHYVDEHYDHGDLIFQARCAIQPDDTPESLANRIHQLEHEHYPRVIHELLLKED
jgi:formyltetrahydrofolate-dependent phosphoribosylglycinamide formyltransferase